MQRFCHFLHLDYTNGIRNLANARQVFDFLERSLDQACWRFVDEDDDFSDFCRFILLDEGADTDIVFCQYLGNSRQDARRIVDDHADVVRRGNVGLRFELGFVPYVIPFARHLQVAVEDDVHDVADNGTGCRQGAGALAVEHDVADAVAADADGIVSAVDIGQRVAFADEGRMDVEGNAVFILACNGQELDDIYFTEEPDKDTITVEIEGLGANSLPRNFDENMVGQAMKAVAIKNRQSLPKGGTLRLVNAIPPARGLGSSSAALVGGILIGNALTGNKMTREDMLTMATVLEGHPDNVAPAIYGGLSVSIMVDGKTLTNSIPIDDDLSFITVSPEVEVSTEEARKALPKTIDYQSAVFNVSRVSFLVSSLFTKQYDRIAYGLQDKLHVPYRLRLIPSGELVLKKAVEAGALGATISGSGSTLIAFATDQEVQIMDAMINCFNDHGIAATGHILKCSNEGAKLVE